MSPPGPADDLKHIHGIGPAIESHLHDVGIQTYAQLAALSLVELAKLLHGFAGISAQQIAKHDWIGQARKLAATAPPNPDGDRRLAERRQRYATFTTDLLLDDDSVVRRTSAAHVQSGAQETWTGWAGDDLIDFFAAQSGMRSVATSAAVSAPPAPKVALEGVARLSGLAAFERSTDNPLRLLRANQPFDVHLNVDLSEVAIPDGAQLASCVQLFARKLGEQARTLLGSLTGSINSPAVEQLGMFDLTLPQGLYRLEASADFIITAETDAPPDITAAVEMGQGLQTFVEGGLLLVY
jgi:hypothetical protein